MEARSERRAAPAAPPVRQVAETRRGRATAAAAADHGNMASEDEEQSDDGGNGQVSERARIALLEVENAALKAENAALKTKLMELLQGSGKRKSSASAVTSLKPGQSEPSPPAAPASKESSTGDRRARLAAAASDGPSDRAAAVRQRYQPEIVKPETVEPASPGSEVEDEPGHKNAVMLVNTAMEAYNEAIPNNIPPESRLPLVNKKLDRFLENFGEKVHIIDLKSGGSVIKDRKFFIMRYGCVFRESGSKLKGITHKRFYYDASGKQATFSLDFETHESLVTATAGTPQDGKLGLRDPRTEHLLVLYEEIGGVITRMWLRPDTEKLGLDPTAGESVLVRTEAFRAFEAKVAEIRGGSAGSFIFHNYHDTPTVGG